MGVVARILGKTESTTELRTQVEAAKHALDEAQLAWGESGSADARDAFMRARDEHDRLTGKLRAAEKRERDERERAAEAARAKLEDELSATLRAIGDFDGPALKEFEREAAALFMKACGLSHRALDQFARRETNVHRAYELATKLGREISIPSMHVNAIVNACKAATVDARNTNKIDVRVADAAVEMLVGDRWVHRGERG